MARLAFAGGEGNDSPSGVEGIDFASIISVCTFDATVARLGVGSAWKYSTGAGNTGQYTSATFTGVHATTYFLRCYIRFPATISTSGCQIMGIGGIGAKVKTGAGSNTFALFANATQVGSDSASLAVDTWYRFELSIQTSASANSATLEFRIDGTTIASTTTANITTASSSTEFGWIATFPGANTILFADDMALNDSTGADQNTWPGDGKVVLLVPTSDNSAGSWLKGSAASAVAFGGTGYEAINNTPPLGTATANATTVAISNKVSGATNPNADFNMTTYTAAGVGATDTVNCVQQIIVHGEDVTTGTKTGTYALVSNPAIAASASFNFGDDVGAVGTYVTNWKTARGAISHAPSVTLGTAPVARITKTDTGTRAADCCFIGIIVDFTPAVVATFLPYSWVPRLGPLLAQ